MLPLTWLWKIEIRTGLSRRVGNQEFCLSIRMSCLSDNQWTRWSLAFKYHLMLWDRGDHYRKNYRKVLKIESWRAPTIRGQQKEELPANKTVNDMSVRGGVSEVFSVLEVK